MVKRQLYVHCTLELDFRVVTTGSFGFQSPDSQTAMTGLGLASRIQINSVLTLPDVYNGGGMDWVELLKFSAVDCKVLLKESPQLYS